MSLTVGSWYVLIIIISMLVALPYITRSILTIIVEKKYKKGQYEEALKYIHSPIYTMLFSKYECGLGVLKCQLALNNQEEIENYTLKLLNSNLKASQGYYVSSLTYYYFINEENKEICDRLLPLIDARSSDDERRYNHMLYNTIIEKKGEDIELLAKLIEENKDNGVLYYLEGLQYLHNGDKKEATRYLNKAKNLLKGTPYHKKVKEVLESI